MLTMSHIAMAKNTLSFLKSQGLDVLDEKSFIYGNIKPDNLFQKTPKKHLEIEAKPFVLEQIEILKNSGSENDREEFSIMLGIVCHYLCDFFCLPHFERWSACAVHKKIKETPRHLNYERILMEYTSLADDNFEEIDDVSLFLIKCKEEYVLNRSYENDIKFASLVCNSVCLYVLK